MALLAAKRQKTAAEKDAEKEEIDAALSLVRSYFPTGNSRLVRLPPVMMKHQLYFLVNDRTMADRRVEALRRSGEVRLFKLGVSADEFVMIMHGDFVRHAELWCGFRETGEERPSLFPVRVFLDEILPSHRGVSVSKAQLEAAGLQEADRHTLVRHGLLTIRDAASYWMALPNAGVFMQHMRKGREEVLRAVRRAKYGEVLEGALVKRKIKGSSLGGAWHLADVVGADLVTRTRTSSGNLLRISS